MSDPALRRVAVVLDQVLTDFGRRTADDPRRLRGLLTDSLGSESTEVHEAIEVIVATAEFGLPQAVLAAEGTVDRAELAVSFASQLSNPELAAEVVDAWITALRVQDRIPTDAPVTMAPPPRHANGGSDPTELPAGLSNDQPTQPIPLGNIQQRDQKPNRWVDRFTTLAGQRKVQVMAGVALLMAVSGVGLAMRDTTTATTTTTTVATSTTASTSTIITLAVNPILEFSEETTDWGATLNRTWEIVGNDLAVTLQVETGETPATGSIFDVFPSSLQLDPTTIVFDQPDPLPTIHMNPSAVRFILELEAATTHIIQYTIPLPDPPQEPDLPDYLQALQTEWAQAMETFLATPPPEVTNLTSDVEGAQATIHGQTTPGIRIEIQGTPIPLNEDGTFQHTLPLTQGPNLITGQAIDDITNQQTTFEITIQHTTTTTAAPAPPPAPNGVPTASLATITTSSSNTWARACVLQRASDPDGDPLTLVSVSSPSPVGTASISGPVSGQSNCAQSVRFDFPAEWHGQATMTWTVSDGQGGTATAELRVTVNDPPTASLATYSVSTTSNWIKACVLQRTSDPDGDVLTLASVSAPSSGGVTRVDGPVSGVSNCAQSVYYEWPPGFTGVAAMTWTVSDGLGGTASAELQVTVGP